MFVGGEIDATFVARDRQVVRPPPKKQTLSRGTEVQPFFALGRPAALPAFQILSTMYGSTIVIQYQSARAPTKRTQTRVYRPLTFSRTHNRILTQMSFIHTAQRSLTCATNPRAMVSSGRINDFFFFATYSRRKLLQMKQIFTS